MSILVVFTENNARILKNPSNFEDLKTLKNVLVDPKLDEVSGLPPHFWKLQEGRIVAMNADEQKTRLEHIEQNGLKNHYVMNIVTKVIEVEAPRAPEMPVEAPIEVMAPKPASSLLKHALWLTGASVAVAELVHRLI